MLAHGAFQAPQQLALGEAAEGGSEAEEADGVGDNARRDQQGRRQQDQHAVDQRARRKLARRDLALEMPQHRQPLPARQRRTHQARDHDQPQGGGGADAAPQLDQKRELHGGEHDEEQEQTGHPRSFANPRGLRIGLERLRQ